MNPILDSIAEAREIRAALDDDDPEAIAASQYESDYYAAQQLKHGVRMETALAKLRSFCIRNRHRCTDLIMDL